MFSPSMDELFSFTFSSEAAMSESDWLIVSLLSSMDFCSEGISTSSFASSLFVTTSFEVVSPEVRLSC